MKSITTIMLSFALSAVIICGLILYGKSADAKDDLGISEKTLSDSDKKNNQLNEETTPLHDLEKQFQEEKETKTALEDELSYREAQVAKFRGRLETSQSRILDIEDKIAKLRIEVEDLRDNLSDLEEEMKRRAIAAGSRDKARHMAERERINVAKRDLQSAQRRLSDFEKELRDENMIKVGLEDELSYHNTHLTKLLGRLETSQSRILYLAGQLKTSKTTAEEKTDEERSTETDRKEETPE